MPDFTDEELLQTIESGEADRIEVLSPGGAFGVVTVENFGQPGLTDYRNPNLAEAMKYLGYVQRFGAWAYRQRKAC